MKLRILLNLLILMLVNPLYAETKFYDLSAKLGDGTIKSLSDYKGQVVLIVNTASNCGFTSQYEGLQEIYLKYKDQGFVVLGFPSNDFGGQEPGSNEEIAQFCQSKFNVTFPLFEKSVVKGDEKTDLFTFLTEYANPNLVGGIKWNFEKFLIGKNGQLIERFGSMTGPNSSKIINLIESELKK